MKDCPDEDLMLAFRRGRLEPVRSREVHEHLDGCPECRDVLDLLDSPESPEEPKGEDGQDRRAEPQGQGQQGVIVERGARAFAVDEIVAGRFRVTAFLGEGAMGQVFRVHDLLLGDDLALKTLRPALLGSEEARARFLREARLARFITHENVCRVFDVGQHQRRTARSTEALPFLVMELLAGCTLSQRLRDHGPLSPAQALPIARQLALALHTAHGRDVLHRDFKPDNILILPGPTGERVVVSDFGLARTTVSEGSTSLSAEGRPIGTPSYMAPEQLLGDRLGPTADIYSFGVVLYEMLTGALPFAVAVQRLEAPPLPPRHRRADLDPRWEAAILRCLRRNPAERYQTAREVLAALEAAAPRPRRRPPSWRWLLLLLLPLLALGALTSMWRRTPRGMVRIPGGVFQMGSTDPQIAAAEEWCRDQAGQDCVLDYLDRERPVHAVRISPFYLDATEVTNADFAAWLNGEPRVRLTRQRTAYWDGQILLADVSPKIGVFGLRYTDGRFVAKSGFEQKPVTQVTWDGARLYCAAHGGRLPTEAEWEYAARGAEAREFPWGDEQPRCDGVVIGRAAMKPCQSWPQGPVDVGSATQDATPLGVRDLTGNVSEWVQDRFDKEQPHYLPCDGPCVDPVAPGSDAAAGKSGDDLRVVRGGSFDLQIPLARAATRSRMQRDRTFTTVGFRCAKTIQAGDR